MLAVVNNHRHDHKKNFSYLGRPQPFKTYEIFEGLQQSTVNSPILFNILTMSLLALFGLNTDEDKFASAYADDMIVGLAGKQPLELQEKLEQLVNNINNVYKI